MTSATGMFTWLICIAPAASFFAAAVILQCVEPVKNLMSKREE
jgi:hypothetical protein